MRIGEPDGVDGSGGQENGRKTPDQYTTPERERDLKDGRPDELDRRIVVHVDRMRLGCEACLARPLLAVLPDPVAERVGGGELRRLPLDLVPAAPVFAVLRPPIAEVAAAEVALDARAQAG